MPCLAKSLASTRRKAVTQLLVAAESDKKLISKEGGNMAGFEAVPPQPAIWPTVQ